METINLGAVLFGLLLLVWLGYAVPRVAERRDLMGQTRAADRSRDASTVRDLSQAARARRRAPEVNHAMTTDRLLTRPADPTRRPRLEAPARIPLGTPDAPRSAPTAPADLAARTRAVLRGALIALVVATALLALLALVGVAAWYAPVLGLLLAAGLGALIVRAESVARERARREAMEHRSAHRALPAPLDLGGAVRRAPGQTERGQTERVLDPADAEEPPHAIEKQTAPAPEHDRDALPALPATGAQAREWIPRPVPRPAYSLRGEVDDLAQRHDAHRRSVLATAVPFEDEAVEEQEARAEQVESLAPALDLDLDAVLARRRGA